MQDIHTALDNLGFLDFESLPRDEELAAFINGSLKNAEFLTNTVPVGPDTHATHGKSGATPSFASDEQANQHLHREPASKASETMHTSSTSLPLIPAESRNQEYYKKWGKPLKLSAKENPLDVSVYKMSAHDKKGAWFARRSVHSGIGFTKFRRMMEREFMTSLAVHEGPGSGAIRGIAADKRLAKRSVKGLGKAEVWQLSAKFGPVTPREFCVLAISSSSGLSDASAPEASPSAIPRHYVNVSRPSAHPTAIPREGLVHGSYESVEMIREIPGSGATPESNLVEWIMITRSDPGGGLPKFMVERGTPGSIVGDVSKFLNWACGSEDVQSCDDEEEELEVQRIQSKHKDSLAPVPDAEEQRQQYRTERAASVLDPVKVPTHDKGGTWFTTIGHAVESAVSGVIPYLPYGKMTHDADAQSADEDDDDAGNESDTSSIVSFNTAAMSRHHTFDHLKHVRDQDASNNPSSTKSLLHTKHSTEGRENSSGDEADALKQSLHQSKPSASDHHLQKLQAKRAELDARITQARDKEAQAAKLATEQHETEKSKAADRHKKELEKSEERYRKEVEKLEQRQAKEAQKAEERHKKLLENNLVTKLSKEKKDWKEKCTVLTQENEILRETLERLQKENTAFVAALGEMPGGVDAIKKLQKSGTTISLCSSSERVRANTTGSAASSATSLSKQANANIEMPSGSSARVNTPPPPPPPSSS